MSEAAERVGLRHLVPELEPRALSSVTATQGQASIGNEMHRAYREALHGSARVAMARKRHKGGGMGGLGIYLMERCADRLDYNDKGNRVTITKNRPQEETPHAT